MIPTISSGASIYGALRYNFDKLHKGQAEVLQLNKILASGDNLDEVSLKDLMQTFAPYCDKSFRTKNPVFHATLNPHIDDLTDSELLRDIARDFMKGMGYANQPYIVFLHKDIGRNHLHIVSVRTDLTRRGKKLDSRFELRDKAHPLCRILEKRYGLKPLERNQKYDLSGQIAPVDYQKSDILNQMRTVLRFVYKNYKFTGFEELSLLLRHYNISIEMLEGKYWKQKYNGILYTALDPNGYKVGNSIKASDIGKYLGYDRITEVCKKGKRLLDNDKSAVMRRRIMAALNYSESPGQFKTKLNRKGYDVLFNMSKDGRITGVTYLDMETKIVFDGSAMGEELSAEQLHLKFGRLENPDFKNSFQLSTLIAVDTDEAPGLYDEELYGFEKNQPDYIENDILSFLALPSCLKSKPDRQEEFKPYRKKKRGRRM